MIDINDANNNKDKSVYPVMRSVYVAAILIANPAYGKAKKTAR